VEVRSGLAPGDSIVIDGADKLRDGAKINLRTEASNDNNTPTADKSGGKRQHTGSGQKK
jgi:multidrug efflux system membrane fusion protein